MKKRRNPRSIIYLLLAVIVLLSPVVLTHWKNVEQHRIAEQYSKHVTELSSQERDAMLAAAHDYNRSLPPFGSPDPWVNGVDKTTPGYQDYEQQLNVGGILARIRIPAVGIDLPVYHGTDNSTLSHGVGHLYGTALPVGGEGTHAVLTGHTGLATLTMFDNLTHMKMHDTFLVEVAGETLAYEVDQISVVLPADVENIKPEADKDLVTLITCTPYGINSHRLLVRGHRTAVPSAELKQEYRSPWQPWMIAAIIISLLVLLYLLWLMWMLRRRKKRQEQNQ
ncbi:class C sortase [Corynebacterium hindlerae]|uniref:Class C sortase n=1 Tax=Corynebacterium hindlerae TaxID=699041 RepID=A0A7G5FDE6_9CORY|nr:class C sortase [Corynebacterium hindlerae]QMV84637.1 class C sortase [Corynebacterium hindlerae]